MSAISQLPTPTEQKGPIANGKGGQHEQKKEGRDSSGVPSRKPNLA